MPAKSKVIKQISLLALARDATGTFGSTTLNAAAAAGAGTISVTAITNFNVGDLIRVGSGEEMELARVHTSTAPAGNTITLEGTLRYAHISGEAVVEQTAYDIGEPTDAGVTLRFQGESQDVFVATRRVPYATLNGFVDARMEFALPGSSLYNLGIATGALLSAISGTGALATPLQFVSDGSDFAGDTNMSLIVVGSEMDGGIIRAELWGVDFDYTGIAFALTSGATPAPVPIKALGAAGGIIATSAQTWTPVTTNKPTKGKLFDRLAEVGTFTDSASPAATTVASGGAAGASTVVVASGASLAAGDYIRFQSGGAETIEIWQLDGVVTNTLTIRGKFYRSQAVGAVVKKQDQTPFAGIAPEGAAFSVGGTVTTLRSATKRLSIGIRPGNAQVQISLPIIEVTLANFARALGIPQAVIAGGVLLVSAANLLTDVALNGLYCRGTLLDGGTLFISLWGPSLDIADVSTVFNNAGQAAAIPLTGKPSSAVAFLNY